ncbi:acyl-CoA dehydrogenase family protein [Halotalea alkalilenta]|uniref:Acyl-CoA dehydrogenase n=1 Tax=Halotalea alkalilenta TaxID=376489 RepID=A0A172YE57_9GAMM|nr:acyl-CoA dehydrogenase family protein [Halotalea alkalilenta]ANF57372.1 acyl-CoA dehydrogenase [Halotalea alkalilenta]
MDIRDKEVTPPIPTPSEQRLATLLGEAQAAPDPNRWLQRLVSEGLDRLPLPGGGATLARWRALAQVAACDLGLVKLFEAHEDALAIHAELGSNELPRHSRWGVWCAQAPGHDLMVSTGTSADCVSLDGSKAWCSGAATLTHALVSARTADNRSWLVAVALDQPGITVTDRGWAAVGMQSAASVDVLFSHAEGRLVGAPGGYVERSGFLHGAAGVAACWYGATARIVDFTRGALAGKADPHRLAHLGAMDVALSQARAMLIDAAKAIDASPADGCALEVARARLAVEGAAEEILVRASRALGAAPLCRDAGFARLMADLPVFIRQSHAERDQAAHGQRVATLEEPQWTL